MSLRYKLKGTVWYSVSVTCYSVVGSPSSGIMRTDNNTVCGIFAIVLVSANDTYPYGLHVRCIVSRKSVI